MNYYKQQTQTDCLLTVAENYVQKPRLSFGRLKWSKRNDGKYLRYSSFAKILNSHSAGGQVIFEGLVKLDYRPAILGHIFTLNGRPICHSYFWDGKRAYCPSRGQFVKLDELDISYVIVNPKINHPKGIKDLTELCKTWDKNCDVNRQADPKPIPHLITLFYNGRAYPGDLERANTNHVRDFSTISESK